MKHEFKYALGEVLRDKVTGFEGVVMVRANYFTRCDHYGLCPQNLKDGKPIDWEWLDEIRLFPVEKEHVIPEVRGRITSGPMPKGPQQ